MLRYTCTGRQAGSGWAVTERQAFIAAHEDELFEADQRAMPEAERGRKKPRGPVVKGLRGLTGGE